MQTFEVLVEETLSGSFIVEAASADEAMEVAAVPTARESSSSSRAS